MIDGEQDSVQYVPASIEASLFGISSFTWRFLFGYSLSFSIYMYLLFYCCIYLFVLSVFEVHTLFHISS